MRMFRNSEESWEGERGRAHLPFQLGTDVFIKDGQIAQIPSVPCPSPGLRNNRPRAAQLAGNVFVSMPKDCLLLTGCPLTGALEKGKVFFECQNSTGNCVMGLCPLNARETEALFQRRKRTHSGFVLDGAKDVLLSTD